jgi:hypothetical protein
MASLDEEGIKVNIDQHLLFRDEDFDDQGFDAAQFVARYRRVTSLESLREQLVLYNQYVQKQLYSIINRDYKDFITITTKLDGLDTRAEMMMKPLFGLQMDMSSLQNGISGSLHLIQDKIDEQREILRKKATIQKLLRVSANMDLAKSALNMSTLSQNSTNNKSSAPSEPSSTVTSSATSKRNRLYRQSQNQIESQDKDLFVCSEYERAAIALRESQDDLADIAQNISSLQNTVSTAMVQELQRNFEITKDNLVTNVRTHLEHYFSSTATEKKSSKDNYGSSAFPATASSSVEHGRHRSHTASEVSHMQLRCFGHCLRAVLSLGRGDIAEAALRTAVMEPFVKNAFTLGKVDGKLGRGTYSGLDVALQEMMNWIDGSQLPVFLSLSDEIANMTSYHQDKAVRSKFNLILHGIWEPVIHILHERFPTMLSVGITNVFSHCFRAIDRFAQYLLQRYPSAGTRGLNAALDAYYKTWKFELYFQLRSREIMTRVDAICDHQVSVVASSSGSKAGPGKAGVLKGDLLALAYTATAEKIGGSSSSAEGVNSSNSIGGQKNRFQSPLPLDADALSALWKYVTALLVSSNINNRGHGFHHEIYQSLAMELFLTVHEHVALRPMLTQCLGLNARLVERYVYHIVLLCNASSFHFSSSVSEVRSGSREDGSTVTAMASPPNAFEQIRNEYLGANLAAANTAASMSIEELLFHFQDLLHFHSFATTAFQEIYKTRIAPTSSESNPIDSKTQLVVERIVYSTLKPVLQAAEAIWSRILQLVVQDCKRPLATAVKAIAGKYRMTNKPAPTTASPYVSTILEPLDALLGAKQSPNLLVSFFLERRNLGSQFAVNNIELTQWKERVLEEITQLFHEQIVTLLDTVRQMDSALQRRQQQRTKQLAGSEQASTGAGSAAMTDSDKIFLQVKLDVSEYAQMMQRVLGGTDSVALEDSVPAFGAIQLVLLNYQSSNGLSIAGSSAAASPAVPYTPLHSSANQSAANAPATLSSSS